MKTFKINEKKDIISLLMFIVSIIFLVQIIMSTANIIFTSLKIGSYNEVRDYVCFRLSNYMMSGQNPYTLDMLNGQNVPFMNLYTPIIPLISALFCKIFSINIITATYLTNIILVVISCIFLYLLVKEIFPYNRNLLLTSSIIICFTFFAIFITAVPVLNCHADTLGIMTLCLLYYVVYKKRDNYILLAIITVSLLFSKQILLLLALPLFIYLFLYNYKNAFKYAFTCVIIFVLSIIIVQHFFPLYWTETIYAQFFALSSDSSLHFAIYNLLYCFYRYWPLLLLCVIFYVLSLANHIKKSEDKNLIKAVLFTLKKENLLIYPLLNIIIGSLALLYLAQNSIDGYKYCQDILAPNMFIATISIFRLYYDTLENREIKNGKHIVPILLTVCSVLSYLMFPRFDFTQEQKNNYADLKAIISEHENETIYLGMNSTQYLVENDMWDADNVYFNDGHIEFFAREFTSNPTINKFFYNEEITQTSADYIEKIHNMIVDKEFGLVCTCGDYVVNGSELEQYYYLYKTIPIINETNGTFDVCVYLPR